MSNPNRSSYILANNRIEVELRFEDYTVTVYSNGSPIQSFDHEQRENASVTYYQMCDVFSALESELSK